MVSEFECDEDLFDVLTVHKKYVELVQRGVRGYHVINRYERTIQMDVKDLLKNSMDDHDSKIEVAGWLVDREDGLFILDDHLQESCDFPCGLKIENQNLMYQILRVVPSLGGGRSLLFYKVRAVGKLKCEPLEIFVDDLFIQEGRTSSDFTLIKFDENLTDALVRRFGNYNFRKIRGQCGTG